MGIGLEAGPCRVGSVGWLIAGYRWGSFNFARSSEHESEDEGGFLGVPCGCLLVLKSRLFTTDPGGTTRQFRAASSFWANRCERSSCIASSSKPGSRSRANGQRHFWYTGCSFRPGRRSTAPLLPDHISPLGSNAFRAIPHLGCSAASGGTTLLRAGNADPGRGIVAD